MFSNLIIKSVEAHLTIYSMLLNTTLIFQKIFRIIPKFKSQYYRIYNKFKFNIYGIKYGSGLSVYDRIYLSFGKNAKMVVGNYFKFTSGNGINPLCRNIRGQIFIAADAEFIVGDNVGISSACIWSNKRIIIGDNVNIGGDCIIMDTDAHNLDWKIRAGLIRDKNGIIVSDTLSAISIPITIKDDAFIGTRSIILKGVTIGARSIIAAGSVVTKSIPADCIAGGNPCKVIKYINGKQQVENISGNGEL